MRFSSGRSCLCPESAYFPHRLRKTRKLLSNQLTSVVQLINSSPTELEGNFYAISDGVFLQVNIWTNPAKYAKENKTNFANPMAGNNAYPYQTNVPNTGNPQGNKNNKNPNNNNYGQNPYPQGNQFQTGNYPQNNQNGYPQGNLQQNNNGYQNQGNRGRNNNYRGNNNRGRGANSGGYGMGMAP